MKRRVGSWTIWLHRRGRTRRFSWGAAFIGPPRHFTGHVRSPLGAVYWTHDSFR